MNIVLLASGLGGGLSVQHVRHQIGLDRGTAPTSRVNLLILDSREMDDTCFQAACAEVGSIRGRFGMNLGVLLCKAPTIALTVAAIRCGLRDVVTQYVSAGHLRHILRVACPDIRLQQFDGLVTFLRTFSGLSATEISSGDLVRREQEVARLREELKEMERTLTLEKETIARREQDLRERTRRFDRQLARLQTDMDVAGSSFSAPPVASPPYPELEAMKRKLDQRSAELDMREKLLTEMQELLTAQASVAVAGR